MRAACQASVLVIAVISMLCASTRLLADEVARGEVVPLLEAVMAALEKVTEYLEADYSVVNVDGLFGCRLCQGSLIGVSRDCSQADFLCPDNVTAKVSNINDRLNQLGQLALPYIKQENEDYFNDLVKTIDRPYIIRYIPEILDTPVKDVNSDENYDYELGISCFSRLMGTYRDKKRVHPACSITDQCWHYMTRNRTANYFTSHQVLFFIIAEQSGCMETLEGLAVQNDLVSVRDIQRRHCGQIYLQAVSEEFRLKMPIYAEDLFLEQTVLCGILGFQNFFPARWIRMVLSWQTAVGCFSEDPRLVEIERVVYDLKQKFMALKKKLSEADDQMDVEMRDSLASQKKEVFNMLVMLKHVSSVRASRIDAERGVWAGRQLMMEKVMSGDCLAHKTGLAIGTLCVYVRHLVNLLFSGDRQLS